MSRIVRGIIQDILVFGGLAAVTYGAYLAWGEPAAFMVPGAAAILLAVAMRT